MLGPVIAVKFPYRFDLDGMKHDLEIANKFEFAKHPLEYHDGTWSVINLIYGGGKLHYTHEGDHGYGSGDPQPTEVLDMCPAFQEAIKAFPGTKKMVRLSALPAGGHIKRHYDPIESVDFGIMRVHVPIVTDERVVFYLGYQRQHWREGEAWYGDFTFPHSVRNRSGRRRVHMILDLEMDDVGRSVLPDGYLSETETARRAKFRALEKKVDWYHSRLEGLLGGHL